MQSLTKLLPIVLKITLLRALISISLKIWAHMDREIRKEKNIADIDDLRKRLGEIWNNIQLDTIRAPLAGVPRRLAECVKLRGKRTTY